MKLTSQELIALRHVIASHFEEEKQHFEGCDEDSQTNHVFNSWLTVAQAVNRHDAGRQQDLANRQARKCFNVAKTHIDSMAALFDAIHPDLSTAPPDDYDLVQSPKGRPVAVHRDWLDGPEEQVAVALFQPFIDGIVTDTTVCLDFSWGCARGDKLTAEAVFEAQVTITDVQAQPVHSFSADPANMAKHIVTCLGMVDDAIENLKAADEDTA